MDDAAKKSQLPRLSGIPRLRSTASHLASQIQTNRVLEGDGLPQAKPRLALVRQSFTEPSVGLSCKISGSVGEDGHSRDRILDSSLDNDTTPEKITSSAESTVTARLEIESKKRRPRPSLAERTVDTLSQIPPSPSPLRRKSGIHPIYQPQHDPNRPMSSLSQSSQHHHKPQVSSTPISPAPARRHLKYTDASTSAQRASGRRAVSSFDPRGYSQNHKYASKAASVTPTKAPRIPQVPSMSSQLSKPSQKGQGRDVGGVSFLKNETDHVTSHLLGAGNGAKTYAHRPTKPRTPLGNMFSQPVPRSIKPSMAKAKRDVKRPSHTPFFDPKATSLPSITSIVHSSQHLNEPDGSLLTEKEKSEMTFEVSPKSSAALRENIAKAKAAHRAKIKNRGNPINQTVPAAMSHATVEKAINSSIETNEVLRKRIEEARLTGKLNISALGLKQFPQEVNNMYDLTEFEAGNHAWYESVDIIRLVAADNEFELLDDRVFPDIASYATEDLNEDFCGNIMRGLEKLDLHGNQLKSLPLGIRQLDRLTSLNLSKNRLPDECLHVISQVKSLRELRLGGNHLQGELDFISSLTSLEILDLHENSLTSLTSGLGNLFSLRILLVAGNKLSSLPFLSSLCMHLTEVDASKNRLSGTLIPKDVQCLPCLKSLDVSHNALSGLFEDGMTLFPSLEVLNVAENRLSTIPEMGTWTNLVTVLAECNQIDCLPEGFISLVRLKNADFSRNHIKSLDNRLGLMENLKTFRILNNPLRERRLLNMSTDDLKEELCSRVLPPHLADTEIDSSTGINKSTISDIQASSVKPNCVLDRSSADLSIFSVSDISPLVESNPINLSS